MSVSTYHNNGLWSRTSRDRIDNRVDFCILLFSRTNISRLKTADETIYVASRMKRISSPRHNLLLYSRIPTFAIPDNILKLLVKIFERYIEWFWLSLGSIDMSVVQIPLVSPIGVNWQESEGAQLPLHPRKI